MTTCSGNYIAQSLTVHSDDRGSLFEILRCDNKDFFEGFGQVYANRTLPGEVKGIHRHFTHSDVVCCVSGELLVLTVSEEGDIQEVVLTENNPIIIKIPPRIWHGWQCISSSDAITVSIVPKPFDPKYPDVEVVDAFNNPWRYKWR